MNLNHLKYFYDSSRMKSLSKAAKLNLVGQPAISKAINALESELQVQLIHHQRNSFQLTESGTIAFQECSKIFDSVSNLKNALMDMSSQKSRFSLACPGSMLEAFLLKQLNPFNKKFTNVEISLQPGRTDSILDWLINDTVDLALTISDQVRSELSYKSIYKGKFFLVSHPQYSKNWKEEGIITTEQRKEIYELASKYLFNYKEVLVTKAQYGSWSLIKKFIEEKQGVGFLPDYLISDELQKDKLKTISPSKLSVKYEIFLTTKSNRYQSSAQQSFSLFLENFFKSRTM